MTLATEINVMHDILKRHAASKEAGAKAAVQHHDATDTCWRDAEARAREHNSTFYECPKCGEEANSAFSKCGCGLEPVSVCEAESEGK